MIKIALYLSLAVVLGYLIGNINFARIFSRAFAGKDITEVGSKNPGTMNMLRTRNFGEAMLTLVFEALKSGAPALVCFFIFEHLYTGFGEIAYFSVAFAVVVGHCFPVFYKFKGGKGVACTFGMFVFHPILWWVSLVAFFGCFVMFFFVKYGFIVTLTYVVSMSTCATVYFCLRLSWQWYVPILIIIWVNFLFVLFMHRGNIDRLTRGVENQVDFKEKLFKSKKKKKTEIALPSNENKEVKNEASENDTNLENEKEENLKN